MNINDIQQHLKDSEIEFEKIDFYYPRSDSRVWSLQIDPKNTNLLVFCKVNHTDYNRVTFDILASSGNYFGIGDEFVLEKIHQLLNR